MKKIISCILVLFLAIGFDLAMASANNVVSIDGGKIVNKRTLVPLRSIFEELGANVQWNQKDKTITATKGKSNIWLKIGSKETKVNGKAVMIDVPAQVHGDSTLVPLRFISESMGAGVEWNASNETAIITLSDKKIIVNVGIYDRAFTNEQVAIKSSPGTSYRTLGVAPAATELKVIGGEPIGFDQKDWYAYEQYGWSKIKYNGQTGWVPTHDLSFADPYNWAPGVKETTINEIKRNFVTSKDKIKLEKSDVVGGIGLYALYVQINGKGEWQYLVTIDPKTGWYHG